jgi:hypothetical protein
MVMRFRYAVSRRIDVAAPERGSSMIAEHGGIQSLQRF